MPVWWLAIGVLVPALAWGQPESIEQWNGNQLGNYCRAFLDDPVSSEGSLCRGFLLGFIAGAEAVQEVVNPVTEEDAEAASFTDRALKTRLGPRLDSQRTESLPLFCVDEGAGLREVVEGALEQLEDRPPDDPPSVSDALCRTLVQAFPCRSD